MAFCARSFLQFRVEILVLSFGLPSNNRAQNKALPKNQPNALEFAELIVV